MYVESLFVQGEDIPSVPHLLFSLPCSTSSIAEVLLPLAAIITPLMPASAFDTFFAAYFAAGLPSFSSSS